MRMWPVLTIAVPASVSPEAREVLCARMVDLGALGFEEQDAQRPGEPDRFVFSFEEGEEDLADRLVAAAVDVIEQSPALAGCIVCGELVAEENWAAAWREHFHRLSVTPRLYVAPPEEAQPPDDAPDGTIVLALEPGSAFGTGTHASTQGCLEMLEHLFRDAEPPARSLIDVGTGSGILCLAALAWGAQWAVGMDKDPLAESNFRLNAGLNHVQNGVLHFIGADNPDAVIELLHRHELGLPDWIACNMLTNEFAPLLEPLGRFGRPMVLSGLLEEEEHDVLAMLAASGWRARHRLVRDGWTTLSCEPAGTA